MQFSLKNRFLLQLSDRWTNFDQIWNK